MTLFEELEQKCKDAGTNLNHVCKEAKVDRTTLEHWKKGDPKTIQILRAIETVITEIAATNKRKSKKPVRTNAGR